MGSSWASVWHTRIFAVIIFHSWAQDFDMRCWEHAAEMAGMEFSRCDMSSPCRSDCWSNFFSLSYCCIEDSTCWWWGIQTEDTVVRSDVARSGVECRHLCQGEPECVTWTFQIPAEPSPESGGM